MRLEVDGNVEVVRIPNQGSFRTASPANAADFVWGEGQWQRVQEEATPIPAPDDRACLIDDETAADIYGGSFSTSAGVPQSTSLGETSVLITTCSYNPDVRPADEFSPLAVTLFETNSPDATLDALSFFELQIRDEAVEIEAGAADRAVRVGPFYIAVIDNYMVSVQAPAGADLVAVGAVARDRLIEAVG